MNIHLEILADAYAKRQAILLVPRFHHSDNTTPAKDRRFLIGAHYPVKIAASILNNMLKIHFDQKIDSKTLPRLPDQRNLQLPKHLTSSAITPKQVFRPYLIYVFCEVVLDFADDCSTRLALKRKECRFKSTREGAVGCMLDKDRLQHGLRDIAMITR
jgi:hypothetical protein